ncbi:WG containing repeat-containing protein [Mucilaginibacter pineti]|uniref:WG containing repeat-containing protein n=1 Tax=Mucilaginibacter pineti TaxID=1391627 RepID=A0A1G7DNG0_9SPHI|nr:YARHG domain-containing protein [Mucilaginibacter pineti]SDE53041.1 WG containing repeat-containing protein [Mucilaginibacter pineti]
MKAKPIIITIVVILVLLCGFLFIRSKYMSKPQKGEITAFLNAFNTQIKSGNTDSASLYFDSDPKNKSIKTLLSVLTGKTSTNGKSKPLFKLSINTEDALIKLVNPELTTAVVAATFHFEGLPAEKSIITFTIHKTGSKQYKFSQVDLKDFLTDYATYQTKVINKTIPEKDIYSPITLAAFKTAEQLKTRYDSVLWFNHVDNKTFYYVVKGTIEEGFYWPESDELNRRKKSVYKIGLVNPALQEIIPVEYDMVHNVGGTINGLVEVEKGNKKGFYNLEGKLVVPVNYDQAYPLKEGEENLALLKNGDDYFYLKSDSTISDKLPDFKIADNVQKIKTYGKSFTITEKTSANILEFNSREDFNSMVISPSYLVDWQILPKFIMLPNSLRKQTDEDGEGSGSLSLTINFNGDKKDDSTNWFTSAFYSVVDDYLGGRSGLYTTKNVLLVDKKQNRILSFNASSFFGNSEGGGELSGTCNENSLKAINDSLFEFKTTSELDQGLLDTIRSLKEGPYYHYLQIKNGKLTALASKRIFPTQFVKLDDSYLQNCYLIVNDVYSEKASTTTLSHTSNEILQCMKNEIYASYQYKFKNKRWNEIFDYRFNGGEDAKNTTVDDSLTTIDKYNINFINSKLNGQKATTLAAK